MSERAIDEYTIGDDPSGNAEPADTGASGGDAVAAAGASRDASAASFAALRRFAGGADGTVELGEKLRKIYIETERDDEFSTALNGCLGELAMTAPDGSRLEGRGIAVVAKSGAGKTTTILRALKNHELFRDAGINQPRCWAISVKCLGSCTLKILGEMLLDASGYEIKEGLRENVIWDMLRGRLQSFGIILVHIDEVNNLIENSKGDEQRIINNLKALINNSDWPVVLVISGTPMIGQTFRKDAQLRRRIDWIEFRDLRSPDDNETLAAHVQALCEEAGITAPAGLQSDIAPRLVLASGHQLGVAAEIGIKAVELAIKARGPVVMEHFATAYARRTGCDAAQNPFVAERRFETDPAVALSMTAATEEIEEVAREEKTRRRRRQTRRRKRT